MRTAYKIDSWFTSMFGECFEGNFTDAAGCTDKDGDEARWKGGRDKGVGELDLGKGDHERGKLAS